MDFKKVGKSSIEKILDSYNLIENHINSEDILLDSLMSKIELSLESDMSLQKGIKDTFLEMKQYLLERKNNITICQKNITEINENIKTVEVLQKELEHLNKNNTRLSNLKCLQVQEEERKRVARELHDSTVQNLTALIYKIEICDKLLETDSTRVHLELQVMISTTRDIIEEIRNIIYDLRPAISINNDISKFVKSKVDELNILSDNLHMTFLIKGCVKKLNNICFQSLTKIIGEALKNIAKHSKAKDASISLEFLECKLVINIFDDGIGFLNTNDNKKNRFGLSIMEERVTLLGGEISINSCINKGTKIFIEIPNAYCEDDKHV